MINNNLHIIGCEILQKTFIGSSVILSSPKDIFEQPSKTALVQLSELWQKFMTIHYEKIAPHLLDENIVSITQPTINNTLKKWAAVEITTPPNYQSEHLNILTIEGEFFGFIHTGSAIQFNQTFIEVLNYLKNHKIEIDESKPRFEIMHRSYSPDDISANEACWIPIKKHK